MCLTSASRAPPRGVQDWSGKLINRSKSKCCLWHKQCGEGDTLFRCQLRTVERCRERGTDSKQCNACLMCADMRAGGHLSDSMVKHHKLHAAKNAGEACVPTSRLSRRLEDAKDDERWKVCAKVEWTCVKAKDANGKCAWATSTRPLTRGWARWAKGWEDRKKLVYTNAVQKRVERERKNSHRAFSGQERKAKVSEMLRQG